MSDRLNQTMHRIAKAEFPRVYRVAKTFSETSGRVDTFDAIVLLNALNKNPNNPGVGALIDKMFMLLKLEHGDGIGELKQALQTRALNEMRSEDIENHRRKAAHERAIRLKAAEKVIQEIDEELDRTLSGPSPTTIKDRLLNFIDLVSYGQCYDLDDHREVVDLLKHEFGLDFVKKGWLVKTWGFTDTLEAQQVRATIVQTVRVGI